MWETTYYLNHINGHKHQIYLPKHFYDDIKNLVFLPFTKFYDQDKKVFSDDQFCKINDDNVTEYFNGETLLHHNVKYHLDYHRFMGYYQCGLKKQKYRFSEHITFHSYILRRVQIHLQGICLIHVRRGDGVDYPIEFFNNLSAHTKNFVKSDGIYEFFDDETYFDIIDRILEINPKQKFYLSHDLLDVDFQHWFDRYPNQIYTFDDVFFQIKEHFFGYEEQVLKSVVDFCAIYESSIKILNPESTFSQFGRHYDENDIPFHTNKTTKEKVIHVLPNDTYDGDVERFLSSYKKYIKKHKYILDID
jgi:hypothetical protein